MRGQIFYEWLSNSSSNIESLIMPIKPQRTLLAF
jgi:hypothetical protein